MARVEVLLRRCWVEIDEAPVDLGAGGEPSSRRDSSGWVARCSCGWTLFGMRWELHEFATIHQRENPGGALQVQIYG